MNTEPSQLQAARLRIEAEYTASLVKANDQYWADIRALNETFLPAKDMVAETENRPSCKDYGRTGHIGFPQLR